MNFKKILRIVSRLLLGTIVILLIGYVIANRFFKIDIVKPYVVQSGSMEPAIKTASIVFSVTQKSYNPGDIVTFKQDGNKDNLITHRIAFKLYPNGVENPPVYKTSGDANEEFDRWEVKQDDIVGKVAFSLPYLGYAVDFAKRPYGFLFLVIIPATIIIYEELKVLGRESFLFLKRVTEDIRVKIFKPSGDTGFAWPKAQEKPTGVPSGEIRKTYIDISEKTIKPNLQGETLQNLRRSSILLPVLGSAFVIISLTASFFSDPETSVDNVFGAADSFGSPVAQTLVINELLYDTNCVNADDKQWIELWNGSGVAVDLQDWSLRDHNGNTIQIVNSATSLPSGKFALISKAQSAWSACFGDLLSDVVTANLGGQVDIDAIGGSIKLLDDQLNIIDRVDYGTMSAILTGTNRSTERKILGQDSVTGDNFDVNDFEKREPSTAGFAIPENQTVIINEFIVDDGGTGQGEDWVEIYNKSGSSVDISNWTLRDTTGTFHTFPAATSIAATSFIATPNFSNRLNNGGDKIYLFDSSGNLQDGISYFLFVPAVGKTIGGNPDGAETRAVFDTPTKGSSNGGTSTPWP